MLVLAIGAHPDDVEIGAAGLIAKLCDDGHDVYILVLTDEEADGARRREEAQRSAKELGVQEDRLLFAAFEDGHLRTNKDSVTRIRCITAAAGVNPDLVIVHSGADSHNDHVEANSLARSAFRGCVFLYYSIYLSGEQSTFSPHIFIDLSKDRAALKERALAAHRSQVSRLSQCDLVAYERKWGSRIGLDRVEALEIMAQNKSSSVFEHTISLSESPFHRFWSPIVGSSNISLLYAVQSTRGAAVDWPTADEAAGRDELRRSFAASWYPRSPLVEYASNHPQARDVLKTGHTLLVGSGVNSAAFHDYQAHAPSRWSVAFEVPRTDHAYLYSHLTGRSLRPALGVTGELSSDFGLLAKHANPHSGRHWILRAVGATGFATRAALSFMANPSRYPDLARILNAEEDVWVAFEVSASDLGMRIVSVDK
ncbi:PIG-L deacetylase family protein [Streptomyces sp. NPDC102394]|uniref:PIG-L deacetylase family protein n=1 Tax=Streptomyces sp. NPDC102394 TaxID=3366167 RepID=UPI0038290890